MPHSLRSSRDRPTKGPIGPGGACRGRTAARLTKCPQSYASLLGKRPSETPRSPPIGVSTARSARSGHSARCYLAANKLDQEADVQLALDHDADDQLALDHDADDQLALDHDADDQLALDHEA